MRSIILLCEVFMKISFSTKIPATTDALVVGAFEERVLSPGAAEIDGKT